MNARFISSPNLPILENSDRVTRDEFERRYHRRQNVKKAELIAPLEQVLDENWLP